MNDPVVIQQMTRNFRADVAGWGEQRLRKEGAERGIPDSETLDRTTLREAIVQHERDRLREAGQYAPQVSAPNANPAR